MAYSTHANVAAEVKLTSGFSSTSAPTDSQVTSIIADCDAEIDGMLATKYQLPLAQAGALAIMKAISIALALDRVKSIMQINEAADQTGGRLNPELHPAYAARKRLSKIINGDIVLIGETLASSGDGVKSYAADNALQPTFERDTVQW